MGQKKIETGSDLVLYSPDPLSEDEIDEEEPHPGLLLPMFFYLSNNTGIIALPTEELDDKISIALSYKVEMIRDTRDKDSPLYTRLRLFYPKTYINLYKTSILYEASPIPSAELRFISILLFDRKREFQRVLYDMGLDTEPNVEFYKQRKIELESLAVK